MNHIPIHLDPRASQGMRPAAALRMETPDRRPMLDADRDVLDALAERIEYARRAPYPARDYYDLLEQHDALLP